jgi:hypothetical protein
VARNLRRKRVVSLTLLALAVPAFALGSADQGSVGMPAPATLAVSTSLVGCGLAGTDVVCELNVSYESVNGASSYRASVTRADGSVVDYGSVGAGGTSLYVPYVGPGTYNVRITAYGSPPEDGGRGNVIAAGSDEPAKAEAEVSDARGNDSIGTPRPGNRISRHAAAHAHATDSPGNAGAQGGAPAPAASAGTDPAVQAPGQPSPPPCEPVPPDPNPLPPDADPSNDDEDADGVSDAEELAAAEAGAPLTIPGTGVECPAH